MIVSIGFVSVITTYKGVLFIAITISVLRSIQDFERLHPYPYLTTIAIRLRYYRYPPFSANTSARRGLPARSARITAASRPLLPKIADVMDPLLPHYYLITVRDCQLLQLFRHYAVVMDWLLRHYFFITSWVFVITFICPLLPLLHVCYYQLLPLSKVVMDPVNVISVWAGVITLLLPLYIRHYCLSQHYYYHHYHYYINITSQYCRNNRKDEMESNRCISFHYPPPHMYDFPSLCLVAE